MDEGCTYTELVEVAREALVALDYDGRILSWNRGAEEAYSFLRDEVLGTLLVELTVPESERAATRELIAAAREGRIVRVRSLRRTKHGAVLHVDTTMQLVTTPGGNTYVAVSELDITRVVERDGLETKLEEVRRLKSEFLANMSHELRTPLNSIIGFAELMHKGKAGPMAADHVEFLGDIISSARRLLQLVNDVLDLAKLESGKIEYHPSAVDVTQAVQDVRDILKSQINSKGLKIESTIDVTAVVADATRLKQVLYSLLSNAVKFTPDGGRIAIRAIAARASNEWVLQVEDTGIGIEPEELPRVFVEFPRIGAAAARTGTGLGLALAQRIVEGHGGHMDVVSFVGKGSTFTATLPRAMQGHAG